MNIQDSSTIYKNLKLFINKSLGRISARNDLTIKDTDIFLTSFPKSGNTWFRFLVGNLVFGQTQRVGFKNIDHLVPDIYQLTDKELLDTPSPRYLKSHECFDSRYKKVVYIVRDPRDVVISTYHFWVKLGNIPADYGLDRFVDTFLSGEQFLYGNWYQNVGSWMGGKKEDFFLVRYEDLIQDPVVQMKRAADFLKIEVNEDQLISSINNSSFENMQKMEKVESGEWKPMKGARKDMNFCRSGKICQWKSELSKDSQAKIWKEWQGLMSFLGYDEDSVQDFDYSRPLFAKSGPSPLH